MRVTLLLLCTVTTAFKLEKSAASSFLSRSKRNYELTADFETACIESHCDVVTFYEVYLNIFDQSKIFHSKMMSLEDPDSVMRQAQYQVCHDFIDKLKKGCPEVTEMIAEYPALVSVIKTMLSSPGVSSSLSGKYTLKAYAEKQLVRTCMQSKVLE